MRPIHAPTASHASHARPMEAARVEESTPYYSRGREDFVVCRHWIIGLYVLALLGILLLGVPALIALALAYVRRAHMEEPVLRSHFNGLIGGIWSYLGIALLALVLVYVGNGLVLRVAGGVAVAALLVLCWSATKGLVRILEWRSYDGSEEIPG